MFLPTVAPLVVPRVGVLVAWTVGGGDPSHAFWVTWTFAILVIELCRPVGRVLFPAVPNLGRDADPRRLGRVLRAAFWGVSGLTLAFFVAAMLAKGPVLAYLNQPDQGPVLTVLLAAAFFEVHRTVLNPVIMASGREKALTALEWAGLGAVVAAGVPAMAAGGLLALAGVFLGVYILTAGVRLAILARATGVRLWIDGAVSAAAVLALAGAWLARELAAG
jgi:hypothetical protein